MKCCVSTFFVFGSLPNGRAPDLLRVTLLCFTRELSIISRDVDMYRGGLRMPRF